MSESNPLDGGKDLRSLALTPTWSVASVLTIFVAVSLLVERSIHRLGNWLKKTDRKPLLAAVEKMKEELMLLGFISLLLTATSSIISNICIPSKFYDGAFAPCTRMEVDEEREDNHLKERGLLMTFFDPRLHRRVLMGLNQNTCTANNEPFVSYEGLEQLHRFIFVMAITHISYSCLTMLLAIVKIHSWRSWEDEAHMDRHDSLSEKTRAMTMQRQSTFVRVHTSNPMQRNSFLVWVTCFFRQFGRSVVRADYLTLRQGFITVTRQVWERIKTWLNIRMGSSTILSTIKWCKRNRKGSAINAKAKHLALAASTYSIWKERNRLVFEKHPFRAQEVASRIQVLVFQVLYSFYPHDLVLASLGH